MSFIYKITNGLNGKVYIGKTTQPIEERWKDHIRRMKKGYHWHLSNAIRLNGSANFKIECIEIVPKEQLNEREIFWIAHLNSMNSNIGYNQTFGGEGMSPTEEIRRKLRLACIGRKPTMLGKKHSEESIAKMRLSHTGKVASVETRHRLSLINKGKIISERQREQISLANKGRKLSAEQCQKISIARSGKPLSKEHKLHISEGLKQHSLRLQEALL